VGLLHLLSWRKQHSSDQLVGIDCTPPRQSCWPNKWMKCPTLPSRSRGGSVQAGANWACVWEWAAQLSLREKKITHLREVSSKLKGTAFPEKSYWTKELKLQLPGLPRRWEGPVTVHTSAPQVGGGVLGTCISKKLNPTAFPPRGTCAQTSWVEPHPNLFGRDGHHQLPPSLVNIS
jgi:hypothetical protein